MGLPHDNDNDDDDDDDDGSSDNNCMFDTRKMSVKNDEEMRRSRLLKNTFFIRTSLTAAVLLITQLDTR
jgi:hypothetical protein